MASNVVIVATIYDCVAKEHGPVFFAMNMGLLWRNVDALRKQAVNAMPDDFVVVVHGNWDISDPTGMYFAEDTTFYSLDRAPITITQVRQLIESKEA